MGSAGASEGARRHGEGGQLCQVTSRRKRRTAESQGGSGACQGPCASRHTRSSHMPTRHPFPAWRACKTRALLAPRFHVGAALRRPQRLWRPRGLARRPARKGGHRSPPLHHTTSFRVLTCRGEREGDAPHPSDASPPASLASVSPRRATSAGLPAERLGAHVPRHSLHEPGGRGGSLMRTGGVLPQLPAELPERLRAALIRHHGDAGASLSSLLLGGCRHCRVAT